MRRNALVPCLLLLTWVSSGYSQTLDSLAGDWHSIGAPDDLTRVVIERVGAGFAVRMWSECVPSECYWGSTAAAEAAGGNSLSARFARSYVDWMADFALLTDGSLQVSLRELDVPAKQKGSLERVRVTYLTKREAGDFRGLPGFAPPKDVPKPRAEGATAEVAIRQPDPPCAFRTDPPAVAFDTAGGDAQVAVHTAPNCAWTAESGAAWLSVTAGASGAGEGQAILHAATNTSESRTGTLTIGGVTLPTSQKGFYRDWKIPLVSFGPNYWTVVRVTNPSMVSRAVKIDVFLDSGDPLRIRPVFDLEALQTLEVVIEPLQVEIYRRSSETPGKLDGPRVLEFNLVGALPAAGSSWARVAQIHGDQMPDLELSAFEEVLDGNKISDFKKEPEDPIDLRSQITIRTSEVRGLQLYFLNLSDQSTTVAFCAANKVQPGVCTKKDSFADLFSVKPNQFRVVSVNNVSQKYIVVRSSNPGKAIFTKLVPAQGTTKVFSSESSISFGRPSR